MQLNKPGALGETPQPASCREVAHLDEPGAEVSDNSTTSLVEMSPQGGHLNKPGALRRTTRQASCGNVVELDKVGAEMSDNSKTTLSVLGMSPPSKAADQSCRN